jgi:aspartate racemase
MGILGTRFLMEGPVYPPRLARAGIEHRIPSAVQRERINRIIYDELVRARLLTSSLAYFRDVVRQLEE